MYFSGRFAFDPPTNAEISYSANTYTFSNSAFARASFSFNGTAVTIFGSKRVNYGNYSVTIDGTRSGVMSANSGNLHSPIMESCNHTDSLCPCLKIQRASFSRASCTGGTDCRRAYTMSQLQMSRTTPTPRPQYLTSIL